MDDRLELFKKTKESVLTQDADFKWVLSFDEKTPAEIVEEVCSDERMIYTFKDIRTFFDDYKVETPFVIT